MTKSRREVYQKSICEREYRFLTKRRKKECNRKLRHKTISSEDTCSKGTVKNLQKLGWGYID